MFKARVERPGRPLTLLGLSGENITRLVSGEPILFDGRPLGFGGHVIIMYGRTEQDIADDLRQHGVKLVVVEEPDSTPADTSGMETRAEPPDEATHTGPAPG